MAGLKALIFDCDGVIAETEQNGHRVAFNRTFKERGINAYWGVDEYGELLKVAGGKERLQTYFSRHPGLLPEQIDMSSYIADLHKRKTEIFMEMAAAGELPIRPGIRRIVAEARQNGVLLAICSTSNERSVRSLVRALLGELSLDWFAGIFAGDVVSSKKPAPDIYNVVKERFSLDPGECLVIEDTRNGLLAAKAAGMKCVITVSPYSEDENFDEADLVVSSLGDPELPPIRVFKKSSTISDNLPYITLADLENLMNRG